MEIYIKARCDFGNGRYAVVCVEKGEVVHKVSHVIGKSFPYKEETLKADQYNSEIVAVCYALQWCKNRGVKLVNLYLNTNMCQKWYNRKEIPEERVLRDAFFEYSEGLDVYAEYIPKDNPNEFNRLVNEMAANVK